MDKISQSKNAKLILALIVAIVILLAILINTFRVKNRELQDYYNVSQSLLTILDQTKNELGQETTKRESLQLHNSKLLLTLNTQDSTIIKLKDLVRTYEKENKRLSNAIIILNSTVTQYQDSIKNIVIDQVIIEDTIYHTYRRDIDMFDKWVTGSVILGIERFDIDLNIYNEYGVTLYSERPGLFKSRVGYVDVMNYNPYTTTQDIRNYEVIIPKCNIVTPFGFGVITGIATSYLIYRAIK